MDVTRHAITQSQVFHWNFPDLRQQFIPNAHSILDIIKE